MAVTALHILVDNRSVDDRLDSEHGWSVWIDAGKEGGWLWDTGQTGLFLANAATLDIDPGRARGLALSHGHYDHAGGLPTLLETGFTGRIVGHPGILACRYSRRDDTTFRSIGMGDGRLPDGLPTFTPVEESLQLAPGLTFVTGIVRQPGRFMATTDLYCDTAGQVMDTVPDDAFLIIETPKGPLVLLGCCHAGLANSLDHACRHLGVSTIHTVVGGLHLGNAPESALAETVQALRIHGVERLYPGHCTGEAGLAYLREHFPGEMTVTGCGMTIRP